MAYQVVEFAGTDRETVVKEVNEYSDALQWIRVVYTEGEVERLGVDITKDGSTEF